MSEEQLVSITTDIATVIIVLGITAFLAKLVIELAAGFRES
jgi:hypothetical protein